MTEWEGEGTGSLAEKKVSGNCYEVERFFVCFSVLVKGGSRGGRKQAYLDGEWKNQIK